MDAPKSISKENEPSKIGLLVASIIILGSLIPNIKSNYLSIENENSLSFLLFGGSWFFFFMAIKLNTIVSKNIEKIGDTTITTSTSHYPQNYTDYSEISKICFFISAMLFAIFLGTLLLKI